MTEFRIVPFESAHAAAFPEFLALGIVPESVPPPAFTALADGEPIVCAGILAIRSGLGEAWAILRQPVQHGQWIARNLSSHLERLMREHHFRRVQAIAHCDRPELRRWMAFLGLQPEGVLRAYALDGADCFMYARIARNGDGS